MKKGYPNSYAIKKSQLLKFSADILANKCPPSDNSTCDDAKCLTYNN